MEENYKIIEEDKSDEDSSFDKTDKWDSHKKRQSFNTPLPPIKREFNSMKRKKRDSEAWDKPSSPLRE